MVARLWARGYLQRTSASDDALDDAARAGLDNETRAAIKAALDGDRDHGFAGVWPQHLPATRAFLSAASQWRTGLVGSAEGMVSRFFGLDYAAAAIAWQLLGITLSADDFGNFAVIESAATALLNGAETSA